MRNLQKKGGNTDQGNNRAKTQNIRILVVKLSWGMKSCTLRRPR